MANQLPQPATSPTTEHNAPTESLATKPKLESVGPTLATTEKLLAEHFSKQLPPEILPKDLHLNLSVHLHEGKENLNFTFTSSEGFGLNATAFSEKVHKIIHEIPAFAARLTREGASHEQAKLTAAETPKNEPNALRFVLKLSKAELVDIARELHGIEVAEKAQPVPAAQPQTQSPATKQHDTALCADGTCGHDHSQDKPTQSAEVAKPVAQPAQVTLANASNDNLHAANENAAPKPVVAAPVAEAARIAEPHAKAVGAS